MTINLNYSYKDILKAMLEDAVSKGLISSNHDLINYVENLQDIENFYIMLLSVIALPISEVYQQLTKIYDADNLNIATGNDLDVIGAKVGLPRIQATYSEVEVNFTLENAQEENKTIPIGTVVYNDKKIFYLTKETKIIPAGQTTITIPCRAQKPGTGQRVLLNELNKSNVSIGTHVTVNNPNNSSGGTDLENDKDYRERLLNWTQINQRGNLKTYHSYMKTVDGIDDYKLVPKWDGTGTLKVIISPGTSTKRQEVHQGLEENCALLNEDIHVVASEDKTVNIYCTCDTDIDQINPYSTTEKEEIKNKIIATINTYIDGGYLSNGSYHKGLGIGEDFIPHKCAVFLDQEITELKNIIFNTPSNYIEISDEEKAITGNLTVVML